MRHGDTPRMKKPASTAHEPAIRVMLDHRQEAISSMKPEITIERLVVRISLRGAEPPVWRVAILPAWFTLPKTHQAFQIVMGWQNYHLHEWRHGSLSFGTRDRDYPIGHTISEREVLLADLLHNTPVGLVYIYDFGDGWLHDVAREGTRDGKFDDPPLVIAGENACPPEDVGGVGGYADFLEALADQNHPEHESYLEWCGGGFDPHHLDVSAINVRLTSWWKRVKKPDPLWLPTLRQPPLEM
jgi:hypothetical protein